MTIPPAFATNLIICNNDCARFSAILYNLPGFLIGGLQPCVIFYSLTKNSGFQVGLDQIGKQHCVLSVGVQLLPQFQNHTRIKNTGICFDYIFIIPKKDDP